MRQARPWNVPDPYQSFMYDLHFCLCWVEEVSCVDPFIFALYLCPGDEPMTPESARNNQGMVRPLCELLQRPRPQRAPIWGHGI